ncbi:class I SAM-dependent methyltransferase [Mangrovimonas spongiae]|uniref:Methyltransferase domain-containing protein n=1 Tax=Mangrovimonas spongiae TaxID=2494697 RepID=A0A3R9M8F5_9FLAO|nr:methyltransferase domain-containing protein [Mangrovimonas spongiae]RSK39670.1 methyltransferase domain-containing protein [Mangrovimonas spongiae]
MDQKLHWNTVYNTKTDAELGWYEKQPQQTLALVERCNLPKTASILNVGAGTTTLVDHLLEQGYQNLIANDLSNVALQQLKERIHKLYNHDLTTICDDLTQSKNLNNIQEIDLWIDRAVLHFFLSEEAITNYFNLIKHTVKIGGFVLIAVFALNGAEKCSGLPLKRYNVKMLQDQLGASFKLITDVNYTYTNPFGGERPYIYTLFQRIP